MARIPFSSTETKRALRRELIDDFGSTSFAILASLVAGSPVGNPDLWKNPAGAPPGYTGGHFRRNWQVGFGGFQAGEIEGVDFNGAVTLAAGRREIDAYKKANRLRKVVIMNPVPYANRLAQGWSRQAEAGWVDDQIDFALGFPGGSTVVR